MKNTYYVPIYNWGDHPDTVNGVASGTQMYNDLQMLFCYEEDAVGYYEVEGMVPTENEYKEKHSIPTCGAV